MERLKEMKRFRLGILILIIVIVVLLICVIIFKPEKIHDLVIFQIVMPILIFCHVGMGMAIKKEKSNQEKDKIEE